MNMTIELAQRIENNQKMHLEFTLPVFALVFVMAFAFQIAFTFFVAQIQDPNEQLIDRLTANLAQLLKFLAQAVRDNQYYNLTMIYSEEPLIKNLARKPNTIIGGMVLVSSAGVINLYIPLVINASPA
ncbi:hypothetical protein G9A89_022612 [Geosiphon pyriformis]|nr:hypothetical protein G9A89_022612 [Geosiphon pyriformis]